MWDRVRFISHADELETVQWRPTCVKLKQFQVSRYRLIDEHWIIIPISFASRVSLIKNLSNDISFVEKKRKKEIARGR